MSGAVPVAEMPPELQANRSKIRARASCGRRASPSLDGGELLLQRFDVLLVHAHRLTQAREARAIFLGIRALLRQRRRSAVCIRKTRLGQELLLGGELFGEHLA